MAREDVRDFMLRGVTELAADYDTEGVELDFAAAPGGTAFWFPQEEAEAKGPVMTEWLRRASEAVRSRPGKDAGIVGGPGLPDAGGEPQDRPRGGTLARGRAGGLPRAHGLRPHDPRLRHAGGVARGGGPRPGCLRVLHAAPLLRRREPPLQRPAVPLAVDVPGGGGQRLAPGSGRPLHLVHVLAPGRAGAFRPRPALGTRADRRGRQALLPAAPHRGRVRAGLRLPLPPARLHRSRRQTLAACTRSP